MLLCEPEPRAEVRCLSLALSSAVKAMSQGSQGESSRKLRTLGRFRHCQVSQSCFFRNISVLLFVTRKRTFFKLSVCTERIPRMLSGVSDGLTRWCRIQRGPRGCKIPLSVYVCVCAWNPPSSQQCWGSRGGMSFLFADEETEAPRRS